jgi:hypothetical protein
MDCRSFRNHHLAYLDDTLSGDVMSAAQLHLMRCDACASHDTMVRKSLMLVRNLPEIEPSDAFSARLAERLAKCKEQPHHAFDDDDACLEGFLDAPSETRTVQVWRGSRKWLVMAAGVTVMGSVALRSSTGGATELELPPVMASAPAAPSTLPPMVSAELVQAMVTGNPMWSMAVLVEDAPAHFLATSGSFEGELYPR